MRRIKNVLAILLTAVIMLTGIFAAAPEKVRAAETFTTDDGFVVNSYRSNSHGWTIVGYTGHAKDLVIPEKIGEYNVYRIEAQAFKGNTDIETLTIPGNVGRINKEAFMDCVNLKSVTFTQAVDEYYDASTREEYLYLGEKVFAGCRKLTSIEFPYGIDFYQDKKDDFADSGLEYAKVVYRGDTRIGMMFNNAPELKKIDIIGPYSLSYIEQSYIHDIPKLEEIEIWPDYSDGKEVHSMLNADVFSNPANTWKPYANCPKLKCITFHVGSDFIGRQFNPIQKSYSDDDWVTVEDDGCVERYGETDQKNSSRNVFVVKAEGTAVFSCAETNIKVRLIVGDGGSEKKNLSEAKAELPVDSFTCTGDEIEPFAVLTYGKTVLVKDTDYTVSCSNNTEIGTAEVTFTGKGDYTGTAKAEFKIVPPSTNIKTANIVGKKTVLAWSKKILADGYQVYYSSKKSKGYKKLYSGTALKTDTTKLKSGMYIKIRTYKKVGKTTYYSEWSAPVQVK